MKRFKKNEECNKRFAELEAERLSIYRDSTANIGYEIQASIQNVHGMTEQEMQQYMVDLDASLKQSNDAVNYHSCCPGVYRYCPIHCHFWQESKLRLPAFSLPAANLCFSKALTFLCGLHPSAPCGALNGCLSALPHLCPVAGLTCPMRDAGRSGQKEGVITNPTRGREEPLIRDLITQLVL